MFTRGDYLTDSKTGRQLTVEAVEGKFLLCKLRARKDAARRSRVAATPARQSSPTRRKELKTTR